MLEDTAEERRELVAVKAFGCVERDDRRRLYIAAL
jgi:hypothetical protein